MKLIIFLIILFLLFFLIDIFLINDEIQPFTDTNDILTDTNEIPFVIICWNNLTFVKNFVNQIKKYNRKIIILNNNSTYEPLYEYFTEIKNELGDKIEIKLLDQNYGHKVYITLKHILPDIYILSDPDLQLNENLPDNFVEILYNLSNKYKIYKIGFALDLSDKEHFLQCENYSMNTSIYNWELQFWQNKIDNDEYELYSASIDTTFCLVNTKYFAGDYLTPAIRIAGNFTTKHLPWYKDYIKNNIPKEEIEIWRKNNKSSSILFSCMNE